MSSIHGFYQDDSKRIVDSDGHELDVNADGSINVSADINVVLGEVEVKNDAGNPIPVNGTISANQAGSWVVGFTDSKLEDSASNTGDAGLPVLGVRNDAAVVKTDTDGDYSMIATDSAGRVGITDLGGSITIDGTVDINSIPEVEVKNDSGNPLSVSGTVNVGNFPASVEVSNDVGNPLPVTGPLTDAQLRATPVPVSGTVTVTDGSGPLTVDGTVAATQSGVWTVGLTNDGTKLEDSAHNTGDRGSFILGVRNDNTDNVLTDANGDYSPIAVDSAGRIRLAAAKLEDNPHVSGDTGIPAWGVRNDAAAVRTDANGDYSPLSTDSAGRLLVATVGNQLDVNIIGGVGSAGTASVWRSVTQSNTGVVIKASAGYFKGYHFGNSTGGEIHVRLYDKSTAPTSADTPFMTFVLGRDNSTEDSFPFSVPFVNGLSIRATKGDTQDADNTNVPVGELALNVYYS